MAPQVIVGDQEPELPPSGSTGEDKWLELAAKNETVAEALAIWGSKPHDWFNLYKVFEIIESQSNIPRAGWASRNEIQRFTRTANHPQAGGEDARHGRSGQVPPAGQ